MTNRQRSGSLGFSSFRSFLARQQLFDLPKGFVKDLAHNFFEQRTLCEGSDTVIVKLHPQKTDDFGWYIYGSCLQQIKGESRASSNPFLRIYFFWVLFGAFWFQGQIGIGKAEEVDWSSIHSTERT